jgi:hypothetical protein
MSVENLQRVLWRLRKLRESHVFTCNELKQAIMMECGTDRRTYYNNRRAMKELQWIRPRGSKRILVTDKDIQDG